MQSTVVSSSSLELELGGPPIPKRKNVPKKSSTPKALGDFDPVKVDLKTGARPQGFSAAIGGVLGNKSATQRAKLPQYGQVQSLSSKADGYFLGKVWHIKPIYYQYTLLSFGFVIRLRKLRYVQCSALAKWLEEGTMG